MEDNNHKEDLDMKTGLNGPENGEGTHQEDKNESIKNNMCFFRLLDVLLKSPGKIFHELNNKPASDVYLILLEIVVVCMILYGAMIGSFAGHHYFWKVPLKVVFCMVMSSLICIPSLYIFSCLNEIQARFSQILGYFLMSIGLSGILLVGFSPVAWIFSQSTNSVLFMAVVHLIFLTISLYFGMKLLIKGFTQISGKKNVHIKLWIVVFIMVIFQMTTTIRPIVGTSEVLFPSDKMFFLQHWGEILENTPQIKD